MANPQDVRIAQAMRLPPAMHAWSFGSARQIRSQRFGQTDSALLEQVEQWAAPPTPRPLGLILCGSVGVGKTGAAVAALRYRATSESACEGVGYNADRWREVTHPGVLAAQQTGRLPHSFAPALFVRWSDLLLATSVVPGKPWAAPALLDAIEERVFLLVVDDLDMGTPTPFRETLLLNLIERPSRNRALILTMNRTPAQAVEFLGERVVDRLYATSDYLLVRQGGPTLRSAQKERTMP